MWMNCFHVEWQWDADGALKVTSWSDLKVVVDGGTSAGR